MEPVFTFLVWLYWTFCRWSLWACNEQVYFLLTEKFDIESICPKSSLIQALLSFMILSVGGQAFNTNLWVFLSLLNALLVRLMEWWSKGLMSLMIIQWGRLMTGERNDNWSGFILSIPFWLLIECRTSRNIIM